MRITKKISSDLYLLSRIGKRKYPLAPNNQNGNNNINNMGKSFSKKDKSLNEEPIKVQLVKNNPNKRIYSTKTVDLKALYYRNQLIETKKENFNNENIPLKQISNANEFKNENINNNLDTNNKYNNLGNIDKLKKYLLSKSPNQCQKSVKINRAKVISVSPVPNTLFHEEENKYNNKSSYSNNNSINNEKQNYSHKIRDLLTHKFTYNKPKASSIMNTPNHIKKSQRMYDVKTFCNYNHSINSDNISVNSFNCNTNIKLNKENKSINPFEDNKTPSINNVGKDPKIKLDDLILYDERLNDVLVALNGKNKNYEIDASNECAEFFVFYFHSSLQKTFPTFFNIKNKIVIESANNLTLLAIMITYHLSVSQDILKDVINMINSIFSLLKMNLYLTVKKMQIFYGDEYVQKNEFYFRTFNYYLKAKNLININEEDIMVKIEYNCRLITSDIKKILKIFQKSNNQYYNDFIVIFNNISVLSEKDINDYFYNKIYGLIPKKTTNNNNNNDNNNNNIMNKRINISKLKKNNKINKNNNDMDNLNVDNCDVISVNSSKSVHYYGKKDNSINQKIAKLINDYERNKIEAPFIKTQSPKKYTIVLDLDETLFHLEVKDINSNKCLLHLRPGLFAFLSEIKPFCELITFTSASKVYAQPIIDEIESKCKYFDYNFFREHSIIYGNDFTKDISRIGRDMKKMIIVDNFEENFKLNKKNGIKIVPYYGDENDTVLFELKKLITIFYKQKYEDLTLALNDYANDIKKKITKEI